jgi:ATP phosphoribosyltransferase regulatory subunit HisZ
MKGPGGTWGMDQQNIHLGKVKIPNAVLALLSGNLQKNLRGNPTELANERRLSDIRADLLQHANREMSEDEFKQAVKAIRQRKDRERAARRLARQDQPGTPAGQEGAGSSPAGTPDR